MALGDVIARLAVNLTLETAAFEEGATIAEKRIAQSAKKLDSFGKGMTDLGQKLSIGMTVPLAAFAKASVDGFIDQETAMADVTAALASMGNASGHTAEQLSKSADALEMNSLVDADVILKQVTANLLTFGNVAGEQFDRAQQAAIDMATRLGGEPQAAAIMLGKALNDPVKGITALTRVGVQFTDAQKNQIKAMTETGNVAGAQGVILKEVERQFKGAAAAAADASPWRKAQVAIGQAMDVVGEAVLPVIKPLADAIASLASSFAALPEPVQKVAVGAAALGAAFGPALIAFGSIVSAGSTIFAALGSIGASMASVGSLAGAAEVGIAAAGATLAALGPILPIVAAVAAVGALIYANWDKIAPVLEDLWSTVQSTLGPPLRNLIAAVTDALSALWNGPLGTAVRAAGSTLLDFQTSAAAAFGSALVAVIKVAIGVLGLIFQQIGDGIRLVTALFQGDWSKAFQLAGQIINRAFGGMPAYVIGQMQALVSGVRTWIVDKLGAIWDAALARIDAVKHRFFQLYDAVVGHSYVPDMVDGIAYQMARLDRVMVDPADTAAKSIEDRMRDMAGKVRDLLARLFPEIEAANQAASDWQLIDDAQASGQLLPQSAQAARNRLLQPSIDSGGASLSALMQQQLPALTQAANDNAGGIETANVRIAKSFKDMADETLRTVGNLASSIKGGGFLDILQSVIGLGLQLGSIGAFGKGVATRINTTASVGHNANGTRNWRGGLSWVGERGPELVNLPRGSQVVPNHDLRRAGGSSNLQVIPSPYFDVVVDGRIVRAAPGIANAGGSIGAAKVQMQGRRRVG
ncbi:phage tail length tape measure family protein [uncultured Novosphingobium sp.]|uniref:phage tail length tape measure family protein n=1 Tax=uncultured Novosphingobium sp. TaxID=292277 RepID=UPI002583A3C3|nr:phage tail length tape measure family protein [uncultured Novosphingobium sp.]